MHKELTSFQESILCLTSIRKLLDKALNIQIAEDRITDEDLKFIVCNYVLILVSSFIDEWEMVESMGNNLQIRETLKDASPATDRIRKWKGLKKIRNQLLAHAHRDNNGDFIPAWESFSKYFTPTNYSEVFLLGNCAIKAIYILQMNHKDQLEKTNDYVLKYEKDIARTGIKTNGELKEELAKVDAAILKRVKWWVN